MEPCGHASFAVIDVVWEYRESFIAMMGSLYLAYPQAAKYNIEGEPAQK